MQVKRTEYSSQVPTTLRILEIAQEHNHLVTILYATLGFTLTFSSSHFSTPTEVTSEEFGVHVMTNSANPSTYLPSNLHRQMETPVPTFTARVSP